MHLFGRVNLSIPLGLAFFAVYLFTTCPTVYVGDSGELTAAAHGLGVPHSSGYPLYTLLGKIFCLIPMGSIGFRMNLMSAVLCAFTAAFLYDLILRMTRSEIASFGSSCFLGFTPLFWSQAVSAEVYALHMFFIVVIIRLLWSWETDRERKTLLLIAFVSGLSFANHMQTVMLAPAVLFLIVHREGTGFFRPKNLIVLSILFLAALSLYLYLPLRTEAGAAITWGDPNTLDRFLDHVAAKTHRGGYVLNRSSVEYLGRAWQTMASVGRDFSFMLLLACWGWVVGLSARWRFFCLLVIIFDLAYTVFLNTVSLKITPFGLATSGILAVLTGLGISDLLSRMRQESRIGSGVRKAVGSVFSVLPVVPLAVNLGICDQSRNYTAYEHAVNIMRTAEPRGVLFIDGDNNVFPVIYARICEGMGEQVKFLDRYNLVFRWPPGKPRESVDAVVEWSIRENGGRPIYLSVFDPLSFPLPDGYRVIPYGILGKVEGKETAIPADRLRSVWKGYSTVSFYEPMERDYMNRQVCSYFHFNLAKFFFETGLPEKGVESIRRASKIGYDDEMIHSDMGIFLTQRGFYQDARHELDLALVHADDRSVVYNNFGYYYDAVGDTEHSIASFEKAVELYPRNCVYLNNLGFELLKYGRKEQAVSAFRRSLEIIRNQPGIEPFARNP